jgi:hypothetical protein
MMDKIVAYISKILKSVPYFKLYNSYYITLFHIYLYTNYRYNSMMMKRAVLSVLTVAVLALTLSSMQIVHASTGLTVNPYVIPNPGGTTTLTLSVSIPAGVSTQLIYWTIIEPDGDTCTLTVPLNVTGPTTVTINKIYPTDAALVWNAANDGCDTNNIGGTWSVYASLITTAGTFSWWDGFTVSFHVIPESAIGIAAISSVAFAGYKVLRSKSKN